MTFQRFFSILERQFYGIVIQSTNKLSLNKFRQFPIHEKKIIFTNGRFIWRDERDERPKS
jgi:hypothetical protein